MCDFLFLQGFDVLMPIFDADAAEAREHHEENLRTCDAVLIYFGAANEVWLRRHLRDIQKAAGFGRVAAAPATAVYLGPPDSPESAASGLIKPGFWRVWPARRRRRLRRLSRR